MVNGLQISPDTDRPTTKKDRNQIDLIELCLR